MIDRSRALLLCGILALSGLGASSASGVSLSLTTDASVYDISDTITVTILGDTSGAGPGSSAFVQIAWDGALANDGVATQTPIVSTFGFVTWVSSNPACLTSVCTVINQIQLTPAIPETPVVIGTLELHHSSPGVITFSVVSETLDFFGAEPPGSISVTSTPEPSTGLLLGLGLLGLAGGPRAAGLRS